MPVLISRTIPWLVVLAAALLAFSPARAQDAYCEDLRARLAAASDRAGDNRSTVYRQLADARAAARAQGCTGLFGGIFGRRPSPYCGRINADIRQLERRLRDLDFGSRWSWGFRGGGDDAGAIRQEMRDAGCSESPNVRTANWGPYRTLCVRTCDGYYFPISSSAQQSDLPTHAAACQAMCPGQQVSLYYQPVNRTDDAAASVSLDGQKYSDLPTAFQFRDSYNPSCTCTPEGGWASVAAAYQRLAVQPAAGRNGPRTPVMVPIPEVKPAPGEDPETLANRAGSYRPEPSDPVATAEAVSPSAAVRFIGPAFYYAR